MKNININKTLNKTLNKAAEQYFQDPQPGGGSPPRPNPEDPPDGGCRCIEFETLEDINPRLKKKWLECTKTKGRSITSKSSGNNCKKPNCEGKVCYVRYTCTKPRLPRHLNREKTFLNLKGRCRKGAVRPQPSK